MLREVPLSTKTVIISKFSITRGLYYILLLPTFQTDTIVKAELKNEAKDLRLIQTRVNSTIEPQMVCLQHTETENK